MTTQLFPTIAMNLTKFGRSTTSFLFSQRPTCSRIAENVLYRTFVKNHAILRHPQADSRHPLHLRSAHLRPLVTSRCHGKASDERPSTAPPRTRPTGCGKVRRSCMRIKRRSDLAMRHPSKMLLTVNVNKDRRWCPHWK